MSDIVARFEFEEFFESKRLASLAHVADGVFVVALKDFVVGVAKQVVVVVDKALGELEVDGFVFEIRGAVVKYLFQAFALLFAADADVEAVATLAVGGE